MGLLGGYQRGEVKDATAEAQVGPLPAVAVVQRHKAIGRAHAHIGAHVAIQIPPMQITDAPRQFALPQQLERVGHGRTQPHHMGIGCGYQRRLPRPNGQRGDLLQRRSPLGAQHALKGQAAQLAILGNDQHFGRVARRTRFGRWVTPQPQHPLNVHHVFYLAVNPALNVEQVELIRFGGGHDFGQALRVVVDEVQIAHPAFDSGPPKLLPRQRIGYQLAIACADDDFGPPGVVYVGHEQAGDGGFEPDGGGPQGAAVGANEFQPPFDSFHAVGGQKAVVVDNGYQLFARAIGRGDGHMADQAAKDERPADGGGSLGQNIVQTAVIAPNEKLLAAVVVQIHGQHGARPCFQPVRPVGGVAAGITAQPRIE